MNVASERPVILTKLAKLAKLTKEGKIAEGDAILKRGILSPKATRYRIAEGDAILKRNFRPP